MYTVFVLATLGGLTDVEKAMGLARTKITSEFRCRALEQREPRECFL
jgi:hypothetical protein